MKKFGTAAPEAITFYHRDNPTNIKIITLNLNSKNARDFTRLVKSIQPKFIETNPKICPGDHFE
jgi:hypothetical protein